MDGLWMVSGFQLIGGLSCDFPVELLEAENWQTKAWRPEFPRAWGWPTGLLGLGWSDGLKYVEICLCFSELTWVNYNDLTVLPHWKSWLVREIIPFYGRTIQVSEIL